MLNLNFTPFPTLYTQRLVLRQLQFSDAPALSALRSMPQVNQYIDRAPFLSIEEANKQIERLTNGVAAGTNGYWVISALGSNDLIGTCCLFNFSEPNLSAELGYELHPAWQGKGIAAEAVEAVIKFANQSAGFKTIEAVIQPANLKSIALVKRFGFNRDETTEARLALKGFEVFVLKK